jgi:hypothetical protein
MKAVWKITIVVVVLVVAAAAVLGFAKVPG